MFFLKANKKSEELKNEKSKEEESKIENLKDEEKYEKKVEIIKNIEENIKKNNPDLIGENDEKLQISEYFDKENNEIIS